MSGASHRRYLAAMTLIELMVAVALGMAIIAMAWTAFVRANASTVRATARVDLHASAAVIRNYLTRDLTNAAPTLAFFARSIPQIAGTDAGGNPIRTDTVEMVFMRMVSRLEDEMSTDETQMKKSDFVWVRWRFLRTWSQVNGAWTPTAGVLYRAESTPMRKWSPLATLTPPAAVADPYPPNSTNTPTNLTSPPVAAWTHYGGKTFINIPRPLRDASQGIESLDNNRYGTAATKISTAESFPDIGDLQDLDRNENNKVVSTRVRDFAIGWHNAHGEDIVVTSSAAADHRIDGLYLDVTGPTHNDYMDQLGKRPRVTRIGFNLHDARSAVTQDFSFSMVQPGFQSQMGQ